MNGFQSILTLAIRGYRATLSPALGFLCAPFGLGCRFTPTCSQYALEAVKTHGAWRGSLLAIRRVCRCHPWGGSGYDPVPAAGARVSPPAATPEGQKLSCSRYNVELSHLPAGEDTRAPEPNR